MSNKCFRIIERVANDIQNNSTLEIGEDLRILLILTFAYETETWCHHKYVGASRVIEHHFFQITLEIKSAQMLSCPWQFVVSQSHPQLGS